jgi:excisionase family DNA binding protein
MLTTAEVSKILGYSDPAVVRYHVKKGHIKAKRFGRDLMIKESDLEKFKKSGLMRK